MDKLTIYSKPNCPWCDRAKELATSNGIKYQEIDLSENSEAKEYILGLGHKTVPQIYQRAYHIGGYEELVQYLRGQEVLPADD